MEMTRLPNLRVERCRFAQNLAAVVCLLLAACTSQTPAQREPITPPAPEPSAAAPLAPTATPLWRDGTYAGIGRISSNPHGRCPSQIRVSGFSVSDGRVRFGSYRGAIQQDGAVNLPGRDSRIVGRLAGTQFEGRLVRPHPHCTYQPSLALAV